MGRDPSSGTVEVKVHPRREDASVYPGRGRGSTPPPPDRRTSPLPPDRRTSPLPPANPATAATRRDGDRDFRLFKRWFPWLVPSFVVANITLFLITMYVNDCPKHSLRGSCVATFLGRFSFQPLKENPLFGPSSST